MMKKKLCIAFILFLYMQIGVSQNKIIERDCLSVYSITNTEMAVLVDSFIMNARSNSHYPFVDFNLYLYVHDNGTISLSLDLRKHNHSIDSIIIYKNPNFIQFFVLHQDILFKANFISYSNKLHNSNLSVLDLIKKLRIKQCAYYKDSPIGYYDTSIKGELEYENQLLGWLYDYYDGKWHRTVNLNYHDGD